MAQHVVGCIGRGHYKINGAYDGETNIVDIAGASVEVKVLRLGREYSTQLHSYQQYDHSPGSCFHG
jgi:hypothetical protein